MTFCAIDSCSLRYSTVIIIWCIHKWILVLTAFKQGCRVLCLAHLVPFNLISNAFVVHERTLLLGWGPASSGAENHWQIWILDYWHLGFDLLLRRVRKWFLLHLEWCVFRLEWAMQICLGNRGPGLSIDRTSLRLHWRLLGHGFHWLLCQFASMVIGNSSGCRWCKLWARRLRRFSIIVPILLHQATIGIERATAVLLICRFDPWGYRSVARILVGDVGAELCVRLAVIIHHSHVGTGHRRSGCLHSLTICKDLLMACCRPLSLHSCIHTITFGGKEFLVGNFCISLLWCGTRLSLIIHLSDSFSYLLVSSGLWSISESWIVLIVLTRI